MEGLGLCAPLYDYGPALQEGIWVCCITAVFPVPRTVTDTWWMPNNYWLYE